MSFSFLSPDEYCEKHDPDGKEWREKSCSVEIRYKYQNEKHLLTKVHFHRDKNVSIMARMFQYLYCLAAFVQNYFREEVVEKIKWNIDRDSMENKQRSLVDLFVPLKRDLHHQV